jgi:energy-converting hydrogenase Eha subunit B
MKYYCALNFNVGGSIKKNFTVERVAEDGPLSPGVFQCARRCNKMGPECAAFGVVAGSNCYLMGAVGRLGVQGVLGVWVGRRAGLDLQHPRALPCVQERGSL